jgi:hypothetical protein
MAFTTTHGNAEYVSQGSMGVRGTYTTKRKYSLSDLIVWQDRKWNMFDNILRRELRTITVDDPEPKVLTKQESPVKFNIHSDGTTTTIDEDTLRISDTLAKFLQAGDILSANQIFCDSDGANYSTTKYNSGYTPESMIVDSVTLSGAAANIANVVVSRGNGYRPTSSVTTVLTEYKLIKLGNALEDGGTAPTAIWHEPNEVQNFAQLFSKTWSETETEMNTNTYGKENMPQKAARKRKEFFREVDGALLFGRKASDVRNGQTRWRTGGIVEYMPAAATALDGTSRFIDFSGAFDLETFRQNMEIAFRYGSDEKTAFVGGKFFTVLYNNLEKFITANDGLSKKWGWTVMDLETGHGILHLLRHPLLSEYDTSGQAWAYDMIGVDLEYVDLMVMKNMDVRIKSEVNDEDEHQRKDEIYAQLGLRRTHPTAHFVIYGITG